MTDTILVALIAIIPGVGGAWVAFRAARTAALRDQAQDRAQVLELARERAAISDADRAAMRETVLRLERQFDKMRSVLRRVVDAFEAESPGHEAVVDARRALEDLG